MAEKNTPQVVRCLMKVSKTILPKTNPDAPNVCYIYLHEWLKLMINVGKYSIPIEHVGNSNFTKIGQGPQRKGYVSQAP